MALIQNPVTEYFKTVPKIHLKHGGADYVSTGITNFSVGDTVTWTNENLQGRVEFIGSCSSTRVLVAVVTFAEPTCHLPGHLLNPPCHRNVIPVQELSKQGQSSGSYDDNCVKLIGNCLAAPNFDQIDMRDYRPGQSILLRSQGNEITGRVIVTGKISYEDAENSTNCIGVKFESTLVSLAPSLLVLHETVDSTECPDCYGNTVAFIPLNFIGKSHESGVTIGRGSKKSGRQLGSQPISTYIPNTSYLFVGQCVALKNNVHDISIEGLHIGKTVKASKDRQALRGVVMRICTISGLSDSYFQNYVGVRFRDSIDGLCSSRDAILHVATSQSSCKKCDNGKVVYIPKEFLIVRAGKPPAPDGIQFSVATL